MSLQSCKIDYVGFNPDSEAELYIRRVIEGVYNEAPYKSVIQVSINKVNEKVHGHMSISSQVGTFTADAHEDDAKLMVQKLVVVIRHQLMDWKGQRFKKSK